MRSVAAVSLFAFALLLVAAPGLAAAGPTTTPVAGANTTAQSDTTIAIYLQPNGDAHWNVTARFPLHSSDEREAFARLATDFENGEYDGGFDVEIFETIADQAAAETGRTMEIRNSERSSSVTNASGRISLTFTWTNFSDTDETRLLVGDAFATESGTWLPRLTTNQRLLVHPPEGYGIQSTKWPVVNRTLQIGGPQTFQPGEPSVIYVSQTGTGTGEGGLWNERLPLALVLFLSAIAGGGYIWIRRRDDEPTTADRTDLDETGSADGRPPEAAAPPVEADSDDESEPNESTIDRTEPIDLDLLSDEERVEYLLEQNGGRMKQASIVKETGWSNAKVSQLLSAMDEDGRINKLRIGRENLISLPDEDVGEFD